MRAIKATYNGEVFVPFTQVNLTKGETVYLAIIDEAAESLDAETIEAMEDARLDRNLYGPYKTAGEAVAAMLED